MPIALNPKRTLWVHLASDENEDPKPEFETRFLTKAEVDDALAIMESADSGSGDYDTAHDKVSAALASNVVGWRNMVGRDGNPIPYDAADDKRFDKLLTGLEKFELLLLTVTAPRLTEVDRKKSTSMPDAAPDSPVPDATVQP